MNKYVINVALGNEALWGTVVLRKEVESEAVAHPAEFGKVLAEVVKEANKHAHSKELGVRYPYTMSQFAMLAFAKQGFAPYVDLEPGYCYAVIWNGETPTFMFSYGETHDDLDEDPQETTPNIIHFLDFCTRWQKPEPKAAKQNKIASFRPKSEKSKAAKVEVKPATKKADVEHLVVRAKPDQKDAKRLREEQKEALLHKAHKGAAKPADKPVAKGKK